MTRTTFHWQERDMTPELLAAVGEVTVRWAMIDNEVTRMLSLFWLTCQPPQARMPRSFDRRINHLVDTLRPLYAAEPDECRAFMWFVHRIKDANGRRDDIAHGIPGTVERKGRKFSCLRVPFPSREAKFVPMTLDKIRGLADALIRLYAEATGVTGALMAVQQASSGSISVWQDPDGWSLVTMDNRNPKLPRIVPPPPTFRA